LRFYTRLEIQTILGIEEGFFVELEREAIVGCDAPEPERYSERMLERARVASNLVEELDVNLPGVAIIVRMREELVELRHDVERILLEIRRQDRR
jgi:MerR family transcriptional regulator/heat shock protein HspR